MGQDFHVRPSLVKLGLGPDSGSVLAPCFPCFLPSFLPKTPPKSPLPPPALQHLSLCECNPALRTHRRRPRPQNPPQACLATEPGRKSVKGQCRKHGLAGPLISLMVKTIKLLPIKTSKRYSQAQLPAPATTATRTRRLGASHCESPRPPASSLCSSF